MRNRPVFLFLALLFGAAPVASAQTSGFVGGLGGVTFVTESGAVFGGQGGIHVGRGLFVIGEVGRMQNVLPSELADQLDEVEQLIESLVGLPATVSLRVRSTYVFGGIRWSPPAGASFRPFLEAGAGLAHLTPKVRVTLGGVPVPDDVIEEFGDQGLETDELMLVLGGGLTVRLTSVLAVDAGYRYARIALEDEAPVINANVVYAALKVAFGGGGRR